MASGPRACWFAAGVALVMLVATLPVDASCYAPVDMDECLSCCHQAYQDDIRFCGILKWLWPPAYPTCVATALEQEIICSTQCAIDFP